jgi:hypothetical protein
VEVIIPARFNGPPATANGGYTCGLVAGLLGGDAEVTLRRPPPLERTLRWDGASLWDGDDLVATAQRTELELDVPAPVGVDEAAEASRHYTGFERHAFPTCFVCGPEREDGLRIFAGAVPGRDVVASPWTPADGSRELVWAALDCPGAFAVQWAERGEVVLGRMAARVDRWPQPGEPHVVVGWPLGEDGRKLYAGTAVFTAAGEPIARARATWIVPATAAA